MDRFLPLLRDTEDLPKCVYARRGKFYYVKGGKWYPLGPDRAMVPRRIAEIEPRFVHANSDLKRYLQRKVAILRARPSSRTGRLKEVTITSESVISMAEASGWRCAVSGVALSLVKVQGGRPYAPSIDRIDSGGDYHPANVRIVCIAVNLAINVWGESVLAEIARSMRRQSISRPIVLDNQLMGTFGTPETRMNKGSSD